MKMPDLHRRIIEASLDTCEAYGLMLAGGYAIRAHGLVDRPSQDVDLATITGTALDEITEALARAYRAVGFKVEVVRGTPLLARIQVADQLTEQSCAVDLMKKPLQRPPVRMEIGPVASLDDLAGMKVAALHGRSVPRDLVDLAALSDHYRFLELERMGARFEDDFQLETLAFQLEAGTAFDDRAFADYALRPEQVRNLRRFVLAWYEDLSLRLTEASDPMPDR